MMSEQEWKKFFLQEEKKLNVGSSQFFARHEEIMRMIEAAKEKNRTRKQWKGGEYYVHRVSRRG